MKYALRKVIKCVLTAAVLISLIDSWHGICSRQ
jgi:hypothetical protein